MRSPPIPGRKIRKRWILAIFAVFLMACQLCIGPIYQTVKAQAQSSDTFSDNFSTNTGAWQYLGSAYWDPINEDVVLTGSGYNEGGVALFNSPIQGPFVANFSYMVGGGNCHGDGFTMFFYKQYYENSIGNGGSLAFSPNLQIALGYGVEFDGWQNPAGDSQGIPSNLINPPTGDPSNAYIALIQDIACNHLAYANDSRVDDGRWHEVSVVVGYSSVNVYVDQGLVLQWSGVLNRTYSGFGFSGATGGAGDNCHMIGNFSISAANALIFPAATPTPTPAPTSTPNATFPPISPPSPLNPNQPSQTFSDDFSTNTGAWQYYGSAYRDATNQDVVLTDSGYNEAGVIFFNTPIQGPFTAKFSYMVGGGNCHGDGFTMFFYKQHYSTFANGGGLAFSTSYSIVPGYGIEFDGWQNIPQDFQPIGGANAQGDPSSAYVGLLEGYAGDHLAYVNDPRVDDGQWHQVSVVVGYSSVSVYVDNGLDLQWSGVLNRTYSGFGFSGATGECGDNWHIIGNVSITAQNMQQPSLTTSCIGSVSQSSISAQINGKLTYNGAGISDAPILLSYSVTGGESWQDLTLVDTASDGSYSALWFPSVTGNYLLQAEFQGNENYLGTSDIVNFAMTPGSEQSVFSVTSNSTLSGLSFDSANNELSFVVSGPSGTTGYVYACIPKSLLNDLTGLQVFLDGNQVKYTAQSQSGCWLLYFSYHHSAHSVVISLGSNANSGTSPTTTLGGQGSSSYSASPQSTAMLLVALTVALMVIVVMAVGFVAFMFGKRSGQSARSQDHS